MSALPFDVVVFDLDGTLVDTAPHLVAALNHALWVLNRPPVSAAAVRRLVGEGARALLREGLSLTGGASERLVEAGVRPFMTHYEANIRRLSEPAVGSSRVLTELLGAGLRLAVCTNKPERLARRLLEALRWDQLFMAVIGGDTLPMRKPEPLPLVACVRACAGGDAVFVGDSLLDLQTARAADMPFVGMAAFPAACSFAEEKCVLVHSFPELGDLLLKTRDS